MKDKKIKQIAQQIADIERKCQSTNSKEEIDKYIQSIQQLVQGLSVNELLRIDEYIQENNLLKK